MTWTAFKKVLNENIGKNIKKIVALVGDVLVAVLMVGIFAVKAKMDIWTGVIMILLVLAPYLRHYVELVFKGEVSQLTLDRTKLIEQLVYEREISEYRVLIAAKDGKVPDVIVSNKDWYTSNRTIESLEKKDPNSIGAT